ALYGTVPRWGRENVIAHALAPSVAAGKVALLFESDGRRYGVVRALVRDSKGTVRTKEARIDELAAGVPLDQAWEAVVKPLAEGEQVTPEVQRVTGLEYRFFTQCVVLPQGRYAEFLQAAPRSAGPARPDARRRRVRGDPAAGGPRGGDRQERRLPGPR